MLLVDPRILKRRQDRLARRLDALERTPPAVPPVPFTAFCAKHLQVEESRNVLVPMQPVSLFHQWLAGWLEDLHTQRGSRWSIVAPRGSAKSTWISWAYPLWAGLHNLERSILIVSDTARQAWKHLDNLKAELEGNASLLAQYPHAAGRGEVWRHNYLRLRNGVTIEAVGTGGAIRGSRDRTARPSLVVVDDPEGTKHINSAVMRERTWTWFTRDLMNLGTLETNVVVLGTTLHRECLVLRLQAEGWQKQLFQSILTWPQRMDYWAEWERCINDWERPDREAAARQYYDQYRPVMDEGAQVLWESREPLYDLMRLRAAIGHAAFESEKQGNPINPEACEWPSDYFDGPGFWFEEWPHDLEIKVLALDPSKGKDAQRGDYSAFVRYGRDRQGVEYVEADLQKGRPVPQIVEDGVEHCLAFGPHAFAVETNQFQELFMAEFQRAAQARRVALPLMPVENVVNKQVRIRRLGPPLAQRKMRFKSRSPGTQILVGQLKDFPVGSHDDGPDALETARRVAIDLYNGRAQRGPTRLVVS